LQVRRILREPLLHFLTAGAIPGRYQGRPAAGAVTLIARLQRLACALALAVAFVLALLLIVDGTRRLIATITAFTIAHSTTLALASLGVLHVPGPPVEALIALSIVFVAAEIVHGRQGRPGLTQRYPWVVSFTFGLLHGLGFASALAEVGLPQNSIPLALLCFNVGVEIGQLIFIAAVLVLIAVGSRLAATLRLRSPSWLGHVPPYAIGGLASYWVFERVAGF